MKKIKIEVNENEYAELKFLLNIGLKFKHHVDSLDDEAFFEIYEKPMPSFVTRIDSDAKNSIHSSELLRYLKLQCDSHDDIYEVFQEYHDLPDRGVLEKMFGEITKGGDHFDNLCNWGFANFELEDLPGNLLLIAITQPDRFKHNHELSDLQYAISYKLDGQ